EVKKRLKEQGIEMILGGDAGKLLMEKGFDPIFGARPLKRTIQRLLEDPLAEDIIGGKFKTGSCVKVARKGEILVFK
ncbi:MAG: hypothetical protein U9R52_01360, partial [Candidatus Omnitrophota bacterium]|nr:hypothetical protein [Candidatus Omnitrophota bacterium]